MGTLAGMSAFAAFATDTYLPALPNLTDDLGVSDSAAQLTLSASFFGIMIGQLVFGPLSDAVGRRRLVIVMTLATTGATLACTLAPNVGFLIAARLAAGIAGGAGIVIARAIAADIAKGVEAARVFSLLVSITMVAPLVAPVIGGVLLTWTHSWRSSFAFLTVFVVLLVVAIVLFVPETLPPERRHGGGVRELRSGAAQMFRDRIFMGYALTQVFGFAATFAFVASSSFVFQEVFGLSPTAYSVVFSSIIVVVLAAGLLNRRLLLVYPTRRLLVTWLIVTAAGGLALIPTMSVADPKIGLMYLCLVVSCGLRPTIGGNALALALERTPYAGTASAILGAAMFSGALVATPVLAASPFNTGLTMALVIGGFSTIALLSTLVLAAPQRRGRATSRG